MPAVLDDISAEILDLKKQIGATILAHYYQDGEIQALADITGDSLKLAREATKVDSPVIVFCGVLFMAETAKMLNPSKKVLLPDLTAGCSLVDACPADKLARYQEMLRENGRKFQTVTYINSSAKVKALSDWVVTSGNAEDVVRNKVPPGYEILFVPDKHLGAYLKEVTGRDMILWEGSCMVHERFTGAEISGYKAEMGDIPVIAHPESPPDVLAEADYVGSTHGMINWVTRRQPERVMMITECSMADNVAEATPHTTYVRPCNLCPHMKRITLDKIARSLQTMTHQVEIAEEVAVRAREAVTRMLEVGRQD